MQKMMLPRTLTSTLLTLALFPTVAVAQPWQGRFLIGVNAVAQTTSSTYSDSFTYAHPYSAGIAGEEAALDTSYELPKPVMPDAGVLVRIMGNIAAGIAYDQSSASSDLDISGRIPHPFFIARPRTVEGSVRARHEESAVHVNAAYVVPATERMYFALSAGPTYFSVKQRSVRTIAVTEAYPYDTATFASADIEVLRRSGWGFNAAVDLGWMFNRTFGVGGLLRYSKATLRLRHAGRTAREIDAGGLHAGVGARVAF